MSDAKIKLSAEGVAQVVAAFKKVQSESNKSDKEISALNKAMAGLKQIIGALGIGALALHLKRAALEAINAADGIGDLAAVTGNSTELISLLSFAAKESGVSMEAMAKSVRTINQNLDALQSGEKGAKELFARIGLSAKDFVGLNADESFKKIATRIGEMGGSAGTVDVVMKLLGKSGLETVEVFQKLADEGFANAEDRAKKLGKILSDDMTKAADEAKKAIGLLQAKSEAATQQFLFGLAPAITDVVTALDTVGGDKGAFKTFGENAGIVVKYVAGLFITLGGLIARELAVIDARLEASAEMWEKKTFLSIDKWLDARRKLSDRIANIRAGADAGITDRIAKLEGLSPVQGTPKAPGKTTRTTSAAVNTADIAKAAKAREEMIKSSLDNQLKIFLAKSALQSDAEKRALDDSIITLRDYYDKRLATINSESAEEIRTLEKQRELIRKRTLTEAGDKEKQQKEIAEIDEKIQLKQIETEGKRFDIIHEGQVAVNNLAKQRLGFENELLQIQGKGFEAREADLEQEVKEYTKMLLLIKELSDVERARKIGQFEAGKRNAIAFDKQKAAAELALNDLVRAQDDIRRQVETGVISQEEGEQRVLALQRQQLPILDQIAEKMKPLALTPEQLETWKQFKTTLKDLGVATDEAGRKLAEVKAIVGQEGRAAATTFFEDWITGAKSASEATQNFAKSVLASFAKILSQRLGEKLFGKLFDSSGGIFGSALNAVGLGGTKAAGGGLITGPGTGTSDSIPAWLSNREFVVRAAVVNQPGVEQFLKDLNSGMRTVRQFNYAPQVKRYAGGGMVGGASNGGGFGGVNVGGISVSITPEMANMTMRDWVEGYIARELANR